MREGWKQVMIADFCKIKSGKGVPAAEIIDVNIPGTFPCYGGNGQRGYIGKYSYDGTYPIIGRVGALCGNIHLATGKFYATEHALVCSIHSNTDAKFLCYLFLNMNLRQYAQGAAQPVLSAGYISNLATFIPSLPEQQRIVDILDREFAKIDALKANAEKSLQAAKDLFQATLKKELEPKEGWSDISIGSVASLITKGASPKWQGIQYVSSGGILFITSENVREGFIDISLPKYVETAFNGKQARSILQKDDVLVNIVGASIGRAAVYTLDVKDANVNQAVALVRLNKDRVFPDYLCCFLNSKMAEAFYTSMKKDTARANLSLENISNIVFPCPKDITEQKAVAKKLHYEQQLCRQVENNYQKTLTLCDDLKQSLLHKAFNGEL